MRISPLAAVGFVLFPAVLATGHDGQHNQTSAESSPAAEFPPGLLLPAIDGPRPWSDKPVRNDPESFQIAIMTDRTGGHRPGIWMDAVRKLNMLRPEFVVSVGDLIEGYTEDESHAAEEWREFLGFIDQLEMRFFFVAGNHDVTNPMLHKLWRQKFGREWYSFDYKGVHFLCLCSEDPVQHIGEDQLGFIRSDLDQHADSRHTLVFLHKPLWTYAERDLAAGNPDSTNWKKVERLLADRPHTVFAGHVHNYVQYERNGGRKYYSLATTGGSSQLRGEPYGEFDHVTWLTMESGGPHVVNLRLDGILPADVVTEESAQRFRRFLVATRIEVAPIMIDDEQGFSEGEIHFRLHNEFGENVELTGEIIGLPLRGLTVDPQQLQLEVGPVGVAQQSMRVVFGEKIEFDRLTHTTLVARLRTTGEDRLLAERLVPVVIDRRHLCPLLAAAPKLDGQLDPRPNSRYRTPDDPLVLGAAETWQGSSDGSFEFTTSYYDDLLVFSAHVTDERVEPGDRLEFIIDGRPMAARAGNPRLRAGTSRIGISAPDETGAVAVETGRGRRRRRPVVGAQGAGRKTDAGYDVEAVVPLDWLKEQQGDDWQSFQLAVVQHDVDEPDGQEAQILWRGTDAVHLRNQNFAHFVRGE